MREVKTERLLLRQLRDEDAYALAEAANNFEIAKWLNLLPHPYSLGDAKEFINRIRDTKTEPFGVFNDGIFIGVIGTEGPLGLGYWFAQEAWGKGFGTEAAKASVDLYFSNPDAKELLSSYVVANLGSARIQEKLGFKIVDRKIVERKHLNDVEHVTTVLTRQAWLEAKERVMKTKRLTLRPLRRSDWKAIQKIGGNSNVASMTGSLKSPWLDNDVQDWVQLRVSDRDIPKTFIIEMGNKIIGFTGIGGNPISLMYVVDQAYWGQGFASEAVYKTLEYTFKSSSADDIVADVFHDNLASVRILEKFGFKCIGEDVDTSLARVEPAPVFLYRLSRTDFESLSL
ncbi:GNAT family N-acetyltransferase [Amylibacter sp. SFDW26]|uniref:GNAT family N-acetyltransferase n=1 Tax=Amylibacter sp. SFDW26 TaxID=2652722 RepID=UPI001261626A|nr:GNAT family N-acetyltransferase [Amylibacter sp. SFDW26]KAB7615602.1 GNAT family N-acetyltransferase [Amylibacter sp. SFDW26]